MSKKSSYKRKMDEYKNASNNIRRYEPQIQTSLDIIKNTIRGFEVVYSQSGSFYGDVADNFEHKSQEVNDRLNSIVNRCSDYYRNIEDNERKSNRLYDHYRELYREACRHKDDD
ncbi:hypothetical protein [Clostridium manihotivorum]|uniref:Uncharacterized protein n=1 Tax=Clostridium manihotivorum TaxID=2320868 RepID=A0A3R5UAH2_9CLOT|nr:hypothetical protein [Clostridium manihotivorum]QAA33616.1 hypothetical protein C1I91_19335 [Clostridium manihotivorum]